MGTSWKSSANIRVARMGQLDAARQTADLGLTLAVLFGLILFDRV